MRAGPGWECFEGTTGTFTEAEGDKARFVRVLFLGLWGWLGEVSFSFIMEKRFSVSIP